MIKTQKIKRWRNPSELFQSTYIIRKTLQQLCRPPKQMLVLTSVDDVQQFDDATLVEELVLNFNSKFKKFHKNLLFAQNFYRTIIAPNRSLQTTISRVFRGLAIGKLPEIFDFQESSSIEKLTVNAPACRTNSKLWIPCCRSVRIECRVKSE